MPSTRTYCNNSPFQIKKSGPNSSTKISFRSGTAFSAHRCSTWYTKYNTTAPTANIQSEAKKPPRLCLVLTPLPSYPCTASPATTPWATNGAHLRWSVLPREAPQQQETEDDRIILQPPPRTYCGPVSPCSAASRLHVGQPPTARLLLETVTMSLLLSSWLACESAGVARGRDRQPHERARRETWTTKIEVEHRPGFPLETLRSGVVRYTILHAALTDQAT